MQELKATLVLLSLIPAVFSLSLLDSEWELWKARHGRIYQSLVQEAEKRRVWENNYLSIQEHNKGNHTYQLGLNMFADLVKKYYSKFCAIESLH